MVCGPQEDDTDCQQRQHFMARRTDMNDRRSIQRVQGLECNVRENHVRAVFISHATGARADLLPLGAWW